MKATYYLFTLFSLLLIESSWSEEKIEPKETITLKINVLEALHLYDASLEDLGFLNFLNGLRKLEIIESKVTDITALANSYDTLEHVSIVECVVFHLDSRHKVLNFRWGIT